MKRVGLFFLALCALHLTCCAAPAMAQSGGAALVYGTPTASHCAVWHDARSLTDAGAACGGGGGGLTNVYDASSCTVASGTGSADAASCIQGLINTANTAGGGVVWVGAGIRNLKSQIVLKANVTLSCAGNGFLNEAHSLDYTSKGTIFAVLWGTGTGAGNDATKAAIQMQHATRVEHCGFWYPSQSASAATPTEYGSTLLVYDSFANTNQQAVDNWCANCYNFLDWRGGISNIGVQNAQVMNNRGSPIHYGVAANFLVDWCTFTGDAFNSGDIWTYDPSPATHLRGWIAANGIAYYFGSAGWVKLTNEQIWGYGLFVSIDTAAACCTGFEHSGGPFIFDGVQADAAGAGILVQAGSSVNSITITGSSFTAFNPYTGTGGAIVSDGPGASIAKLSITGSYGFRQAYVVWLAQASQTIGDVSINGVHAVGGSGSNDAYTFSFANSVTIVGSTYTGYGGLISATGTYTHAPILIGDYQ